MSAAITNLPSAFVQQKKQERIVHAFAELVTEQGYDATKISDIVKRAGVGRKTLYDNFDGKEAVARALAARACPSIKLDLGGKDAGLSLLVIELAAEYEAGVGATERAEDLCAVLREFPGSITIALPKEEDGLLCSLPPGRHGLSRDFVEKNQRWRLFAELASSIAERGYRATSVGNICAGAALSGRTFYEHFEDRQAVGPALVGFASTTALAHLEDAEPDSGWTTLIIEVVAAAFGGEVEVAREARRAEDVLRALIEHTAGHQSSETKAAAA